MFWNRKKPEPKDEPITKAAVESIAASSMDLPNLNEGVGEEIQRQVEARTYQRKAPAVDGVAMDSACTPSYQGEYGAVNLRVLGFFAGTSSFIGYSNMAIIAQHWLITKGCSMTVKDAVKKWYEISVGNGVELDAEQIKIIEMLDKKYKLKKNMVQGVHFNNVFGIRHILYKNTNADFDYSKPFNPDGWGLGDYAGMSQIDPYWIVPEIDSQDLTDPTSIDFYEPTYWNISGKRYHKSHFVILIGDEVSDLLKPTYRYGGISKVQQVYERVYAAERSANEAPQLLMTKRLTTRKMDLAKVQGNKAGFVESLLNMVSTRDSYGVNVIGKDEELGQLETSLADLDNVIMNQYQIVCAIYGEPASKLLGSGHGGLGTGETDEDYNIANIEQLQGNELEKIAQAHYERLIPCEIEPLMRVKPEIELNWRPLKVMSAKEKAEINNLNANTDSILDQLGYIDMVDGAKRLANDPNSGYTGMDIPDIELPDHGNDDELGAKKKYATDEGFEESKVKRDDGGKFSSSGSGGGKSGETTIKNKGENKTQIGIGSREDNLKQAEISGFNVDNIYVHSGGSGLGEISEKGNFPGIFSLEGENSGYGNNTYEFALKSAPWDDYDISEKVSENYEKVEDYIKNETTFDVYEDEFSSDSGEVVEKMVDIINGGSLEYDEDVAKALNNSIDEADFYKEAQSLRMKVAKLLGADAIKMDDEFGDSSVAILPGDGAFMISGGGK